MNNKRRYQRYQLDKKHCQLSFEGTPKLTGFLTNISQGGASIILDDPRLISLSQEGVLHIDILEKPKSISFKITWLFQSRFGVDFDEKINYDDVVSVVSP